MTSVIGVTGQRADRVVVRRPPRVSSVAAIGWPSVACGLISMNVPWSAPAAAMAWRNRTGRRTLATQYSGVEVGGSVVGSATVEMNGIVGASGARSASAARNVGQDRVHQRGVRGDLHVHPPREPFCAVTAAITASTSSGSPATTVWPGDRYPAISTLG